MGEYYLTEVEEKLIEKYQLTNDQDIAVYFFNKLGGEILNIIYSKINLKFTNIPFEREDLTSFVWRGLKQVLKSYKKYKGNLWQIWINNSYYTTINEIRKYYKNTELILNYADSWEVYENTHCIFKTAKSIIETPKESFKETLRPIIDYVANHNKTYTKTDIKKLLYLKSFGFSEREIAKKMHVSRRYITSMIKVVLKISKKFLRASDR